MAFSSDASNDVASSCALHCSGDLHNVLDCNGNVVLSCPASEGCANGGCVAACQAATTNKSSIGCEYYALDPDVISEGAGDCYAAYIANTWTSPITISVDYGAATLDTSTFAVIPSGTGQTLTYAPLPGGQLPPGEVAILFLAQFEGSVTCPSVVAPAVTASDAALHGTATNGTAFHITTSAPVVAYDIFPYGGGSAALTSATLLLPTSAWATNYIAVNAYPQSVVAAGAGAAPSLDIVASQDSTMVTILPIAAIAGGPGVGASAANHPQTYPLNKGEVLQFTQPAELSGSPIQSNYPIGVWGGATCLNIDVNTDFCDEAHQQIPPVQALGSEYAAVRYRNRGDNGPEETPPWRIVGLVDGTTLAYDPSPPTGAPPTLAKGQVTPFNAAGPFTVKSQDAQHPFYMSAHMSSCTTYFPTVPGDCRGDPEFVNVVPPQQFLSTYTFYTDPTYPETNLVIVRPKASDGTFKDVTLDCLGVLTGWMPVDNAGNYEYTRTDLVRYNFEPQGNCNNGVHTMSSDAPFGLTVWGWGTAESTIYSVAVSYAYPAGMSVLPINTVVVPPMPQ
jgi:hypothetical protein